MSAAGADEWTIVLGTLEHEAAFHNAGIASSATPTAERAALATGVLPTRTVHGAQKAQVSRGSKELACMPGTGSTGWAACTEP